MRKLGLQLPSRVAHAPSGSYFCPWHKHIRFLYCKQQTPHAVQIFWFFLQEKTHGTQQGHAPRPLIETWYAVREFPSDTWTKRAALACHIGSPCFGYLDGLRYGCFLLGLLLACCHRCRGRSHAISGDGTAACSGGPAGSDHCLRGGLQPSNRSVDASYMLSRMGPLADVPLNLLTSSPGQSLSKRWVLFSSSMGTLRLCGRCLRGGSLTARAALDLECCTQG